MSASAGISSLLWFVVILAAIPLSMWLLKRTPMGGAGAGGQLKSIAALPISANQRIVTVEVGSGDERRWLVLGVTAGSITTLHTMAPQAVEAPRVGTAGPAVHPAFARILERLQRRPASSDAR